MTIRLLLLGLVALPARALGDAEEATLRLNVGPAVLRLEDALRHEAAGTAPGFGLAMRGAYGVTDHVAIEVGLGVSYGHGAEFPNQALPPPATTTATEVQDVFGLRATAGVQVRLGVVWVPTITLFTGFQHRMFWNNQFVTNGVAVAQVPSSSADDLLVGVGVGLERRLGTNWVFGISLEFVHAFVLGGPSYDALEAPLSLAYSFYPRWFHGGWAPGGEPVLWDENGP